MPATTFEEVWDREFAPVIAARRHRAAQARTEAFLEHPLSLLGEPVRQMTARDLLTLDALGNPFVAGSPDGELRFLDVAGFVWELSPENNHTSGLFNLWRRARLVRRLARLEVYALAVEIGAYCDRMFADFSARPAEAATPEGALRREPRTHFLAPLLVELTAELGAVDPAGGAMLIDVPLPRLGQYARIIREQRQGARLYDEADSLRAQCLARLNELNALARAA